MLECEREVVQRLADVPQILIDDAEVAISFGNIVAITDRFQIRLHRLWIVLIIQQQRFFKRRAEMCDSACFRTTEETQLSLKLGFDLANAMTQRAQFANASKLRQRLEVVSVIV